MAGEAEEVAAQLGHVGGQVRHVLGAVDQHSAPAAWAASASWRTGRERAEHVGHGGDAQQLGPVEQPVEVGEVERVVGGHRDEAQLDAPLLAQHQPRHEVGVVLDLGEHDDVAGGQVGPAPGVGDQVEGLGDVLGEDDAGRRTAHR